MRNSWIPFPSPFSSIFVNSSLSQSSSTGDVVECGKEEKKCRTLSYSISRWHPIPNQSIFPLNKKEYEEEEIKIEWRNIIILPSSSSDPPLPPFPTIKSSSSSSSLFQITTGALEMKYLKIIQNTFSSSSSSLFLISNKGEISLSSCFLSPEEEKQAKLITTSLMMMKEGGKIELFSSSFSSFSFNTGGIIEGMNGGSVEMNECSFEKIKRKEGNGIISFV
jgi:hypothetical protein